MNPTIEKILSIPKSLYVNFKLMPFREAIKMPIFVRYNCHIKALKGLISVNRGGVKTAMLQIGFGNVGVFDKTYQRSMLQIEGKIELNGKACFGHGSRICVTKNGTLTIGKNFVNTAMMTLICDETIIFGDNVTTSWNTLVMDTDWHAIKNTLTNEIRLCKKPIHIEDKVWLCTRSVVLKGSQISEGCIVGANAVVSGKFTTPNTLIAGNPAKEIKHNLTMDRTNQE